MAAHSATTATSGEAPADANMAIAATARLAQPKSVRRPARPDRECLERSASLLASSGYDAAKHREWATGEEITLAAFMKAVGLEQNG